jgi:inorganic phosphate transporter, PiT family
MSPIFLALCSALVAYANGANANFKGVATLYGSGTATFRIAMIWAALATAAGALLSISLSSGILAIFSGKGLVPSTLVADPRLLGSVAVGAMITCGLATRLGFPVSTTHALTGGLLGAGLAADPTAVNVKQLGSAFLLPLFLGPVVALAMGWLLYRLLRPLGLAPDQRSPLLDGFHYLSAGAVCFARGLNDLPKLAALLSGVTWLCGMQSMLLMTVSMTLGGLISARAVAETLAHKISGMDPGQGCTANLSTAVLVIAGSLWGLPLSTTHVSVGSMLGIGTATGRTHWRTAAPVLMAWVVTLPCAALLAAGALTLSRLA